MKTSRQSGFTLIELLIALAIASILLGVGVPSFVEMVRNARIGAQYNQVVGALYLARSEAVKSSELVVVCSRSAPEAKTCGDEEDWTNGWIVFVDADSGANAAAQVEAGDTIIALEPSIEGGNTAKALAKASGGGNAEAVSYVRYLPQGNTNWEGASIIVCDDKRGSESSRVANVRLTGDIQKGRPDGTETVPRDAFNTPIDCGDGS